MINTKASKATQSKHLASGGDLYLVKTDKGQAQISKQRRITESMKKLEPVTLNWKTK